METVKETLNTATSSVTNAIFGEQTEKHRSMTNDHVSKGTYSGRIETADDAMNTERIEPSGLAKPGQGPASSQDTQHVPSGSGGTTKPQRTNVACSMDTNTDTNIGPQSNKDEPNRGFSGDGNGASAQPSVSAGGTGNMGQTKLPEDRKLEEGTGTQYVKSTGLQADGGDFDASRPGAGREADRLLEEAGIHHGAGGGTAGKGAHGSVSDAPKDQHKGIGEKIKEKLHSH